MSLNFVNNKGFKWSTNNNTYAKGYILGEDNNLYLEDKLVNYFSGINNEKEFLDKLIKSNGCFSVIFENEKYIFAAVDRIRSMPIFYREDKDDINISDSAYAIQSQEKNNLFSNVSKKQFLLVGYVTGSNTLDENIKQLNAGQYLVYEKNTGKLYVKEYFFYKHEKFYEYSQKELIDKLQNTHLEVFKDLIKTLNGKTVVLPLSGGYDSRLVAVMLKILGYTKVICFSYGKKNNNESKISKKLADYLGYDWIFVEYTHEKWKSFIDAPETQEYFRFASNLTSLPHIQDFIAVREMKEKQLIPIDSVFIPGHAADFLEGSHLSEDFILNSSIEKKLLINLIYKKHYSLWDWKKDKKQYSKIFQKLIEKEINIKDIDSNEVASSLFEQWDWKERQAKFITNSVRVYEFFGYEWRLPLWDNKLLEYWSKIKLEFRINRNLYLKYDEVYFKEVNKILNNINNSCSCRYLSPLYKIAYRFKIINLLKSIKKFININSNKKKIKEIYLNHPLQWYGIITFEEFKRHYTGMENINSFLSKLYVEYLENDNNNKNN